MKKTKTPVRNTIIGIDLGDRRHAVCILEAKGKIIGETTMTNTRESFARLVKQYPGARVAIEVGSHSPWISRLPKELGCEVIVANSRKLRAIYENE